MIQDSSEAMSPAANVAGEVDRHPLALVAHVLTSIAITALALAVGLVFVGALLNSTPTFIAGWLTLLAGVTLELRAKALGLRAMEAVNVPGAHRKSKEKR